jgi:ribonuclease PH
MKNLHLLTSSLLVAGIFCFSGCDDDDDGPKLTGNNKVYELSSVSDPAISGTVTFAERDDDATLITIQLEGTESGDSHPAHIHSDNAAKGGGIVLDLTAVDGATGESETVVTTLNDGTPISYDELLNFDGYVNAHMSATDLATLVAQGDIGQNELTGESEEYTLNPVSNNAISGTALFEERVNGETKVTIDLDGTTAGVTSPSHIHANTAAQGGGIVIDLTSVDGTTGMSVTNVTQLNSGTAITYDELLEYNGYLNVHLNATTLGTLIAQGDIGQNALTGTNKVYTLNSVSDPNISGTATFAERKNGNTLITLSLIGTTGGNTHPAHIHANSVAEGGGIVLDLTSVNGATGKSATNVTQMKDGTPITYAGLLAYDGYINVHLSAAALATLVAQGNIGSNAP